MYKTSMMIYHELIFIPKVLEITALDEKILKKLTTDDINE
jgi:hypothetical protein